MFSEISKTLDNKNVLILGFGREGRSTLDFIKKHTNPKSVTVADLNPLEPLQDVFLVTGRDYQKNLEKYDVIIKSPGVVYENPTDEILSKTTSQTTLFLSEFKNRTIGVTGTKGKSTTSSLIYHVLKENSIPVTLGGNIGVPPLSIADEMAGDDVIAVLEMSCHQLEYEIYSPHVAVILNLFEDHLDHYGTREKYVDAKRNIYRNQNESDIFICDSTCTRELAEAKGDVISVGENASVNVFHDGFEANGIRIPVTDKETSLVGSHNVFNIATAFAVASHFSVEEAGFLSALKTFKPLSHRLEYVKTVNGVDYYDDSISTVCQTTIQAISSLEKVSSVIIGGMDRGIDYTELVRFLTDNPLDNIILLPDSGLRIAKMLDKQGVMYILAEDLEDAVDIAVRVSPKGTKCILSPAAASYGFFKNFEHRGEMFREYLNKY